MYRCPMQHRPLYRLSNVTLFDSALSDISFLRRLQSCDVFFYFVKAWNLPL